MLSLGCLKIWPNTNPKLLDWTKPKLAEEMATYKLETAGLDKVFSEAFVTALSEGKLKQHLLSEEGKFHH